MALELNGTTGVSLVQDGVVTAADLASGAITSGALPTGSVLQVVQVVESSGSTGTTQTTDIITGSITPSSSSNKILIIGSISFFSPANHVGVQVTRGGSLIGQGTAGTTFNSMVSASFDNNNYGTNGNASYGSNVICYFDSPSTTSSTTYIVRGYQPGTAAWYINRSESGYQGSISTLTLMEIAG